VDRELFGELIAKNGFARFMDGADRNELAVATLIWSASKASSDGVDPPILAAALTGIAILPKGGINVIR